MNIIIAEVLQHLDSSLLAEYDYNEVNTSLDFLLRKSFNGEQIFRSYTYLVKIISTYNMFFGITTLLKTPHSFH